MNKAKTILIILIAILGAVFLFSQLTKAQADQLVVEYFSETENKWKPLKDPLFKITNFLPGQNITRLVRVTNNSDKPQRIAIEAINYPKPIPHNDLSRALMIIIREGLIDLYGGSSATGPKSLYNFYQDSEALSEIYLSNLEFGKTSQYSIILSFPLEKGNEWQNISTRFDLLIGFQGIEGTTILSPIPPPVPPQPPALTVLKESERTLNITETSITIVWQTNYLSTSQVIYSRYDQPRLLDLNKPNYGYTYSKEGDDSGVEKVIDHSVTLSGLIPATTYYYRCVSQASPLTISAEFSFTTKKAVPKILGPVVPRPEVPGTLELIEEIPETIIEEPKETVEEITPFAAEKKKFLEEAPQKGLAALLAADLSANWNNLFKGRFLDNLIFWVFITLIGFLFCLFSIKEESRIIFGILGFVGICLIVISNLILPSPIIKQLRLEIPDFLSYSLGIFLFIGGFLVSFSASKFISFKVASNITKSEKLIDFGFYEIIRHPLYLGFFIAYLGWCFLFKALIVFLFSPVVFLLLLILSIFEERDLLKKYGENYLQYTKRVPWRIIPKII